MSQNAQLQYCSFGRTFHNTRSDRYEYTIDIEGELVKRVEIREPCLIGINLLPIAHKSNVSGAYQPLPCPALAPSFEEAIGRGEIFSGVVASIFPGAGRL